MKKVEFIAHRDAYELRLNGRPVKCPSCKALPKYYGWKLIPLDSVYGNLPREWFPPDDKSHFVEFECGAVFSFYESEMFDKPAHFKQPCPNGKDNVRLANIYARLGLIKGFTSYSFRGQAVIGTWS